MGTFFVLIVYQLFITFFITISVDWILRTNYYSEKQYKLWRILCFIIGSCYLLATVCLAILIPERFSEQMLKIVLALSISSFITMSIFLAILYFIAWIGTHKELENKIRKCITNYKEYYDDNKKLLEIVIFENQDYPKKTIKKIFFKIIKQNNGQLEKM